MEPGKSTRQDVVKAFGAPQQTEQKEGQVLLRYGAQVIRGTQRVQFVVEASSAILERIEVTFSPRPSLAKVKATLGRECPDKGPPGATCYHAVAQRGGKGLLQYLGVVVRMEQGKARSATFRAPSSQGEPGPLVGDGAKAEPEEGPPEQAKQTESSTAPLAEAVAPAPAEFPPPLQAAAKEGGEPESLSASAAFANEQRHEGAESGPLKDLQDTLQMGAQFYLRTDVGVSVSDPKAACCELRALGAAVSTPFLVDAYLDGRPNDRVRGLLRARLNYNPLPDSTQSLESGARPLGANPGVLLDQLILSFDLARVVFLTVGRQHLQWGVSHVWSPTDYLIPTHRSAVAIFDERLGADLIKAQLPWEATSSSFYAIGMVDSAGPPQSPLRPGVALRAETALLGRGEVGIDAVFQRHLRPRYGADLSIGVGPLDFHGELSIRRQSPNQHYRLRDSPEPALGAADRFEADQPEGTLPSVAAGLGLPLKRDENHAFELSVEGFYQSLGYVDDALLPFLLSQGLYEPLYFGKYYATAAATYNWTDFSSRAIGLRVISNLLDHSYLGRLDVSVSIPNSLTINLFAEVPFGKLGGEFRQHFDLAEVGGVDSGPSHVNLSLFRCGIGLRLSL